MEHTRTWPNKWNEIPATEARHEETAKNCNTEFHFVNLDSSLKSKSVDEDPSVMSTSVELEPEGDLRLEIVESQHPTTEIRRGELWVMSGRFLARWREQFCVLTKNSIYFLSSSSSLGSNRKINKLQLTDICDVVLIREKGQLIVCLEIRKLKRILLRKEEGIRGWYDDILNNIAALKAKNYRRCVSIDVPSRPKRPLMGISSLRYDI